MLKCSCNFRSMTMASVLRSVSWSQIDASSKPNSNRRKELTDGRGQVYKRKISHNLLVNFCPEFLQELLMVREAISNIRKCFTRYQNTSKLVKKNSACTSFFNPLFSVWISDETLFLVFDILLQPSLVQTLDNALQRINYYPLDNY